MKKKVIEQFQKKILDWYVVHKRSLPWRDSFDPYWVFVSEVMSQQTQVMRVIPKFDAFIKKLPTIESLARCDKTTLLTLWSGLGFNSRALRLQKAAQVIVDQYDASIPHSRELLLQLPGIGPYTSASICAFAYNLPEPVIDTNIRRVLISELDLDISISLKELEELARACIPSGRSNDWHNALMDYGSLVATSAVTGIKPLSKQSTFAGSDREVRGRILKQLTSGISLSETMVSERFPNKEIKSIMRGMVRDQLIVLEGSNLTLEA